MKKIITNITAKITRKHFFIATLSVLVFFTSFLMVLDAKEFYDGFFSGSYKSWIMAILLEAMVIVLGNMWFEKKWVLNICIKGLMICSFVGLIVSASMHSVVPAMKLLQNDKHVEQNNKRIIADQKAKQKQAKELIAMSKMYMDESKKSSDHFRKIGWVKNSAMKSQSMDKVFKNISKTLSKTIDTKVVKTEQKESVTFLGVNISLLNIIIILCLRVLLQTSSLVCSIAIGIVYRSDKKAIKTEQTQEEDVEVVDSNKLENGIVKDDQPSIKDLSTLKKLVKQMKRSNKVVAKSNGQIANAMMKKDQKEEEKTN